MDWDELESIMYRYWVGLPEPKIDYTIWWYSDGGVKDVLQTYHIDKKEIKTYKNINMERPIWARRG